MVLLCNLYVFVEWKYCDFFFKMTEKNIQIRLEIVVLYFLRIKQCYFTHTVNNNIHCTCCRHSTHMYYLGVHICSDLVNAMFFF